MATGCYENVLVIDEFEPTKPGAFQVKYYARGVGNIRTGWRGKTEDHEVLTLRKITRARRAELAQVREIVYAMEKRAYVYASTPPAEPWPPEARTESLIFVSPLCARYLPLRARGGSR